MGTATSGAYWYSDEAAAQRGRAVLQALRDYREAERAMRKRTRTSMGMNETDMAALRHIMAVNGRGDRISPKDLALHLEISAASVSSMLDRLERTGYVVRAPNPSDARSVTLSCTPMTHSEVRSTLADMHAKMMAAVEGLAPEESAVIVDFLRRITTSVASSVDPH